MAISPPVLVFVIGVTAVGVLVAPALIASKAYVNTPQAQQCDSAVRRHLAGVAATKESDGTVQDSILTAFNNAKRDTACKGIDMNTINLKASNTKRKLKFEYRINGARKSADVMVYTGSL